MPKIMLVEDDNNLREIYGARLQAEGHTIVSANDGEEALALAVKEKPDLIISDVMMPRISGFDMLDILRNAPETKNTKVIMMTALSQAEDKSRADKLGADMYLVKSQVTLEDVAKAVDRVLSGETDDGQPPEGPDSQPESSDAKAPETQSTPEPSEPSASPQPEPAPNEQTPAEVTPAEQPAAEEPAEAITPEPTTPEPTAEKPAEESASSAKKIEITEHSEPQSIKPEQAESKAALQSAPLEVVLPSSPDETASSEAEPAEESEERKDEQPVDSAQPEVGPNLNEVLTDEAKEPTQETESKPQPEKEKESSENESLKEAAEPPTSEADKPAEPAENPLDEGSKKKVIQPINDPENQKDIVELAKEEEAKEEANEAVQNPPANSLVEPVQQPSPDPSQNTENERKENNPPPPNDIDQVAL